MTATSRQFHAVSLSDVEEARANSSIDKLMISRSVAASYLTLPGACPEFPIFFYADVDGCAASYMRTIPDVITVNGTTRAWAWTGDNYTEPRFRNRGLSTALQRWATSYLHDMDNGRGSVFSTDVTLHTFEKLGFTLVGYAPRYLLLRTPQPYLAAKIRNPVLRLLVSSVAASAMTAAMAGLRRLNSIRMQHSHHEEITWNDRRWEELLEASASSIDVHFDMSAATLQTKLSLAQRAGSCRLWLISDRRSNRNLAYLITRERFQVEPLAEIFRDFRLMTAMDFGYVANDSSAADAVASHLIEIFLESDCEVLELISTNLLLNRAVTRRGMLRVGRGMSFNYSVPESWNWPAELTRIDSWPISNFSGDAFTY